MTAVRSQQTITFDGARQALAASIAHAKDLGLSVCGAVVDSAGQLLAYGRMDGASLVSAQAAQDKAWTALAFGVATDELWSAIQASSDQIQTVAAIDRAIVVAGGLPLLVGECLAGGIGVSGGTPDQDRAIADTGRLAINEALRPVAAT